MKKLLIVLVMVGCIALLEGAAYALPMSGQDAVLSRSTTLGGDKGGGEFLINIYEDGQNTSIGQYYSFCLEFQEHISLNARYNIANVSDFAELGGGGAINGKDPVSDRTKWLLWNYLYGSNADIWRLDGARANAVQQVIWRYEEEDFGAELSEDAKKIMTIVDGVADLTLGVGEVKVINLEYGTGDNRFRQSQLVAQPVPEPGTMLLFGTGLFGFTAILRKRRKKL